MIKYEVTAVTLEVHGKRITVPQTIYVPMLTRARDSEMKRFYISQKDLAERVKSNVRGQVAAWAIEEGELERTE